MPPTTQVRIRNSELGMLITGVSLGKQQEGGAEIRNPKFEIRN